MENHKKTRISCFKNLMVISVIVGTLGVLESTALAGPPTAPPPPPPMPPSVHSVPKVRNVTGPVTTAERKAAEASIAANRDTSSDSVPQGLDWSQIKKGQTLLRKTNKNSPSTSKSQDKKRSNTTTVTPQDLEQARRQKPMGLYLEDMAGVLKRRIAANIPTTSSDSGDDKSSSDDEWNVTPNHERTNILTKDQSNALDEKIGDVFGASIDTDKMVKIICTAAGQNSPKGLDFSLIINSMAPGDTSESDPNKNILGEALEAEIKHQKAVTLNTLVKQKQDIVNTLKKRLAGEEKKKYRPDLQALNTLPKQIEEAERVVKQTTKDVMSQEEVEQLAIYAKTKFQEAKKAGPIRPLGNAAVLAEAPSLNDNNYVTPSGSGSMASRVLDEQHYDDIGQTLQTNLNLADGYKTPIASDDDSGRSTTSSSPVSSPTKKGDMYNISLQNDSGMNSPNAPKNFTVFDDIQIPQQEISEEHSLQAQKNSITPSMNVEGRFPDSDAHNTEDWSDGYNTDDTKGGPGMNEDSTNHSDASEYQTTLIPTTQHMIEPNNITQTTPYSSDLAMKVNIEEQAHTLKQGKLARTLKQKRYEILQEKRDLRQKQLRQTESASECNTADSASSESESEFNTTSFPVSQLDSHMYDTPSGDSDNSEDRDFDPLPTDDDDHPSDNNSESGDDEPTADDNDVAISEEKSEERPISSEEEAEDTSLAEDDVSNEQDESENQIIATQAVNTEAVTNKEIVHSKVEAHSGTLVHSQAMMHSLHKSVMGNIRARMISVATPTPGAGDDDGDARSISPGVWASGLYGTSVQGSVQDAPGYKGRSYGGTVGFDIMINDALLGVTYSNVRSNFSYSGKTVKTNIKSHIFSIYGHKDLTNTISLQASGSVSRNYIKNRGQILNQQIVGNTRNNTYSAEALLNYKYLTGQNITIIPNIGIRYGHSKDGIYKEGDMGMNQLSITGKSQDLWAGVVGTKILFAPYQITDSIKIMPGLHGSIERHFNAKNERVTVNVIHNNQKIGEKTITLPKQPKMSYNVGASLLLEKNNIQLSVEYDYHAQKKYHSHQGFVKLKIHL